MDTSDKGPVLFSYLLWALEGHARPSSNSWLYSYRLYTSVLFKHRAAPLTCSMSSSIQSHQTQAGSVVDSVEKQNWTRFSPSPFPSPPLRPPPYLLPPLLPLFFLLPLPLSLPFPLPFPFPSFSLPLFCQLAMQPSIPPQDSSCLSQGQSGTTAWVAPQMYKQWCWQMHCPSSYTGPTGETALALRRGAT